MGKLSPNTFRKKIQTFYAKHYRPFPWRQTTDPYCILVSEIMLQQTQTQRVIGFYTRFIKRFPTPQSLAKSSTLTLLRLWKGLGYNRRALSLRSSAQKICSDFAGSIPQNIEELLSLPGVGRYTAQALLAFAFNKPALLIETNIRTVLIHEFFPRLKNISDKKLEKLLAKLLPKKDYRNWYYALMDYGVWLKSQGIKTHRQSKHYKKQSPFKGSRREMRGKILRYILQNKKATLASLANHLCQKQNKIAPIVNGLIDDQILVKSGHSMTLATQ